MKEYIKAGAATPRVQIGAPAKNAAAILELAARHTDCAVLVFPELCITGYTCADLFGQSWLLEQALAETVALAARLPQAGFSGLAVVGLPVAADNQLFNCAAFLQGGKILALCPKRHLPNYHEFYERRWFAPAQARRSDSLALPDAAGNLVEIPFGEDILVCSPDGRLVIAAELCEDLWAPAPPSGFACLAGANLIVNPSASNETISKQDYRRDLVRMQSGRCVCGYIYASAGQDESTTDLVFSGHDLICANGAVLAENIYPDQNEGVITAVLDMQLLANERRGLNSYMSEQNTLPGWRKVVSPTLGASTAPAEELARQMPVDPMPFVPSGEEEIGRRCAEIARIQATGLAQRLRKTGMDKLVIGMSGGLDSTLAFLVAADACKLLGLPADHVLGVTMPCVGTTSRTRSNAETLVRALGADFREIDIKAACVQHLRDLGHAEDVYDVAFENTQARERTQILMDLANMNGALVVGTGDLSELALGWCTYNGDHMSMYGVNGSIPKTLVKTLVKWHADTKGETIPGLREVLYDILDTPISPELLPVSDTGEMQQKTEDTIGKYDLHDFFLYQMVRRGFAPAKVYRLACQAWPEVSPAYIRTTLQTFYRRFFTQQFKRSCLPDGVKVGSVALSPRGDWRMPSDADGSEFLAAIDGEE